MSISTLIVSIFGLIGRLLTFLQVRQSKLKDARLSHLNKEAADLANLKKAVAARKNARIKNRKNSYNNRDGTVGIVQNDKYQRD